MPVSYMDSIPTPVSPFAPLGIPRLRTGFSAVPVIVAVAGVPGSNVVTLPIVMFGVAPVAPCGIQLIF